ncbi:MAG: tRNA adenosine(34) deaminase TadA [Pseudomonadota bacterium]
MSTNHILHEAWMARAMALAKYAESLGEVPVGAVAVLGHTIIGEGYNLPIKSCDPTAHAEILALRMASRRLGNYRLNGVRLYVTLEPCAMCATAMIHARIDTLVFAAKDHKLGAAGSLMQLINNENFNHQAQIIEGVLQHQASSLLSDFFKKRREKIKAAKRQARLESGLDP